MAADPVTGVLALRVARGALAALALTLASATTRAEIKVEFSPLVSGPDFDEALEFFGGYFKPEDYDTEYMREWWHRPWQLGKTLDLYLREFVRLGKGDIDDDGVAERFYLLRDPGWCGSKGCRILIVQRLVSGFKKLCTVEGNRRNVWITDWVSEGGHREIQAAFQYYWRDGGCYSGDPELLREYGPEDYPRPPTERHWRPIP